MTQANNYNNSSREKYVFGCQRSSYTFQNMPFTGTVIVYAGERREGKSGRLTTVYLVEQNRTRVVKDIWLKSEFLESRKVRAILSILEKEIANGKELIELQKRANAGVNNTNNNNKSAGEKIFIKAEEPHLQFNGRQLRGIWLFPKVSRKDGSAVKCYVIVQVAGGAFKGMAWLNTEAVQSRKMTTILWSLTQQAKNLQFAESKMTQTAQAGNKSGAVSNAQTKKSYKIPKQIRRKPEQGQAQLSNTTADTPEAPASTEASDSSGKSGTNNNSQN